MAKVHPIEHLRYVARAHGADPVDVALGAADALAGVARDPGATLVSARRLVEHHPLNAQLWAVCAHAVTSIDVVTDLRAVSRELSSDPTSDHVVDMLDDIGTAVTIGWSGHLVDAFVRRGDVHVLVVDSLGDGQETLRHLSRRGVSCELVAPEGVGSAVAAADVTVVSAVAVGDDEMLCMGGTLPLVCVAYCLQTPVWTVTPAHTRLPRVLFEAMVADVRGRPDPWASGTDLVASSMWGTVVGPTGADTVSASLARTPACPPAEELLRRSVV